MVGELVDHGGSVEVPHEDLRVVSGSQYQSGTGFKKLYSGSGGHMGIPERTYVVSLFEVLGGVHGDLGLLLHVLHESELLDHVHVVHEVAEDEQPMLGEGVEVGDAHSVVVECVRGGGVALTEVGQLDAAVTPARYELVLVVVDHPLVADVSVAEGLHPLDLALVHLDCHGLLGPLVDDHHASAHRAQHLPQEHLLLTLQHHLAHFDVHVVDPDDFEVAHVFVILLLHGLFLETLIFVQLSHNHRHLSPNQWTLFRYVRLLSFLQIFGSGVGLHH
mmetsp:Transcript_30118/g.65861  ORF Transcript_30118/g.65861 Transcript_30118/m.65861 type:complete len:275 (-) Transcript_30118:1451-2275(-)